LTGICTLYDFPKKALRVELPPYLKDYGATLLRHPAAQWATCIYRLHRGYSAEIAKRTAAP
jgi:hypothetical protein